jgi:hypothetical protein
MGQSRRFDDVRVMSAFPPLATRQRTSLEVRFVPFADIGAFARKVRSSRNSGLSEPRWHVSFVPTADVYALAPKMIPRISGNLSKLKNSQRLQKFTSTLELRSWDLSGRKWVRRAGAA